MIGGVLGAITGLIGAGLQASAQAAQQQIAWRQLQMAERQAREQRRLATAARTDQYGNRTSYDDIANEWKIALSPTQSRISKAGEREDLLKLTEDAPAARKQKRAIQKRAKDAAEPYNEAVNAYRYREPKSEGAIRDEITNLLATNEMARAKENQSTLMRGALRLGRGQDIPKLIKATDDQLGSEMAKVALQARQGAVEERGTRLKQHSDEYLPEIQMWAQLMQSGGEMPDIQPWMAGRDLNQTQGQMSSALQQAIQSGAGAVGSAYGNMATAAGRSPDLSGIAAILARLDNRGAYGNTGGSSWHQKQEDRPRFDGGIF